MIKVHINKNLIVITGHAGYAEAGKDIVCASVSSIVITSINAALRINADSLNYEEKSDKLVINVLSSDKVIRVILENMIAMLDELALTYKKNIKIIKEEEL